MLRHHLIIAFRHLSRNRAFTLINMLGLAFGLALFILIRLWIDRETSVNAFHRNGERLYRIMVDMTEPGKPLTIWQTTPALLAPLMQEKIPGIEQYLRLSFRVPVQVRTPGKTLTEQGLYADSCFFEVLSFNLLAGDPGSVLDERDNIVISESMAGRMFGDREALGQIVEIREFFSDELRTVRVAGVFQDPPETSGQKFDFVMPFETYLSLATWNQHWGNFNNNTYLLLANGVEPGQINEKIRTFIRENRPDHQDDSSELFLHAFTREYLYSDFTKSREPGGRILYVRIFRVIAFAVLIIAIINYVNLTTATSHQRLKEVGVKKTVGARRSTLTAQFLIEAAVVNVLACALALLMVNLAIRPFNLLLGYSLALPLDNAGFYLNILAVLLVAVLLSGLYPALAISGASPLRIFRKMEMPVHRFSTRDVLVVFQFALASAFILGILFIHRQIEYIRTKNIGLDRQNVIGFHIRDIGRHREAFRKDLLDLPGVSAITFSNQNPLYVGSSTSDPRWEGKPDDATMFFHVIAADREFTQTLGIELLEGELLPENYNPSFNAYLINETAARAMGLEDPVGKSLTFWNENEGKIYGVIRDFHHQSFHSEIRPLIIYHNPDDANMVFARIDGTQLPGVLESVRTIFQKHEPEIEFSYKFLDEEFDAMYRSEITMGRITGIFTLLALFISCSGLFGLALYTIHRQSKEIAVRKVHGASVGKIALLLSSRFVRWVALGFAISLPAAVYLVQLWLENFAYRIGLGWEVFVLTGATAILTSMLTVGIQTLRAAMANPVHALRYE
jgi:putative ABC transport system permease protein